MAALIYSLCALTCLAAAVLLWLQFRRTGLRMLFWSSLCFFGLTANNVLLVLDRFVYTDIELIVPRLATALVALLLLLFGLIWGSD